MRRLVRALATGAVAGAVLATTAGCSGSAGAASPTPAPSAKRTRTLEPAALAGLHDLLPVTSLLFTPQLPSARAQRKVAIACMAEHGYRYAPTPPASDAGAGGGADGGTNRGTGGAAAEERPQPFGLESSAPPRTAAQAPSEKPPRPGSPESTDAYARALFGRESARVSTKGLRLSVSRPGEGCLAEAEKRLLGDGRMRWLQVRIMLFEAQQQARADVEKDPAFRAATTHWRACMDRAKVKAQDPVAVLNSLRSADDRKTSPAASADLRCKAETGYLTTAYQRLAAAQQHWLDRHPAVGADWKKLSDRQNKAAGEVLGTKAG
ncbi:hypothetical protein ABZ990_13775 [Streptomyces sp. NPDC046203]|uniref:hypothetical protein n=1 Tax=Streptomyces sp. NPDC046203 TaxID=3154602 RepID=UPI0033E7D35F